MQSVLLTPPAGRPEMYFVLILLLWRYEITSERRRAREKISLGAYSESFIFVSTVLPWGFFLHWLKIKTNLRRRGAWTASDLGVGTAWAFDSLRHPVCPSYHSKSLLFFQPGFMSPSSHPALPSLTLFLPALTWKEEDLTAVCKDVFATVLCGAGW